MNKFIFSAVTLLAAAAGSVGSAEFVEKFNGSKLADEWQIFWQEKCDTIDSTVKNNTLTINGLKNAKAGANASYDRFIGEIGGDLEFTCNVQYLSGKGEISGGYTISVSNANGESFFRVNLNGSEDGKKFKVSGRQGHQSQLLKSTPVTVKAPAKGVLRVTRTKSLYVVSWNNKEVARINSDLADASLMRIAVSGVNPGGLQLSNLVLKSVGK